MSRKEKLKRFAKTVQEHYGTKVVELGMTTVEMPRLASGSLGLDIALGGGLPVGRLTMLYGAKSSGKTTTAYRIAALAQGLCANCLRRVDYTLEGEGDDREQVGHCDCHTSGLFDPKKYPDEKLADFKERIKGYAANSYEPFRVAVIDLEGSYDVKWARKLGLDESLILYARPDTAEEAIDLYDSLMRTGAVDLFILDSIAAMTPSKEVEESTEKWQQGLQARLVNKFCRKVQATANSIAREYGRAPTQIWINQIRMKIGVMFGNPETVPGGLGQGFATSVEVKLWANDFEKETFTVSAKEKMDTATSVRINFRTEKNKTAPPKRTGCYVMDLENGGIDDSKLIYSLAERFGEIEKVGSKWRLGCHEHKTKREMMDAMMTTEHTRLRDLILKKSA